MIAAVVSDPPNNTSIALHRRWMRRSPTTPIMVALPLVASLCWVWVVVMLALD